MSYASSRPADRVTAGTLTATTTAAALAANAVTCFSIVIQNDPNSAGDLFIGGVAAQPYHMLPGQSLGIDINDVTKIYCITTSTTALVNWMAVG